MTRALLLTALVALLAAPARAQCGCPAPWEPPTVPLPTLQPWTEWVWLAWVGR